MPMIALNKATLTEYLRSHYALHRPGLAESTLREYAWCLGMFERWAADKKLYLTLAALEDRLLLQFMGESRRRLSAARVNCLRRQILAVWRAAADDGFAAVPGKIALLKEPKLSPIAWWPEEFSRIVRACDGREHGATLKAVLLVGWDTDARISAILPAKRSQCDFHRRLLTLLEPKTRTEHVFLLSEATVVALQALPQHRDSLFGWPYLVRPLRERLEKLLSELGLPHGSRDKFHKIRRSKYTAVAKRFGIPAATEHAGHSCDLSKHYLDRRQLASPEIVQSLPPPVAG